jgi:hypothetical protein
MIDALHNAWKCPPHGAACAFVSLSDSVCLKNGEQKGLAGVSPAGPFLSQEQAGQNVD